MLIALAALIVVGWTLFKDASGLNCRATWRDIVWHQDHKALLQCIDVQTPGGFASLLLLFQAPQFSNFRFQGFDAEWLEALVEAILPWPSHHQRFLNSDVLLLNESITHFFEAVRGDKPYWGIIWPADVEKQLPFVRSEVAVNMLHHHLDYSQCWLTQPGAWLAYPGIWKLMPLTSAIGATPYLQFLVKSIKNPLVDKREQVLFALKYWQIMVYAASNGKGKASTHDGSLELFRHSSWRVLEKFRLSKRKPSTSAVMKSVAELLWFLEDPKEKGFWQLGTLQVIIKGTQKGRLHTITLAMRGLLGQLDMASLPVNSIIQLLHSLPNKSQSVSLKTHEQWRPLFLHLMHFTSRNVLPLEPFETRLYKFQIAHLAKRKRMTRIVAGTVMTIAEVARFLGEHDLMMSGFLVTGTMHLVCKGSLIAACNMTELVQAYLDCLKSVEIISKSKVGDDYLILDPQGDFCLSIFRAVIWLLLVRGEWDDSICLPLVRYWLADPKEKKKLHAKVLKAYKSASVPAALLDMNVSMLTQYFRSSDPIFKNSSPARPPL